MENNSTATFVFDNESLDSLGREDVVDNSNIEIEDMIPIAEETTTDISEPKEESETKEEMEQKDPIMDEPSLVSNSSLKDVLKQIGISSYIVETDDGEETVNVDETDLDLETTVNLISNHYQQEIEELRNNTISTENVDKDRKEIVEFILKGGDPKKLIEYQSEISDVKQYDLDDPSDAEEVIRKYYSYKEGTSKEEVDAIIIGAKAQDRLTSMAETASVKITEHVEKLKEAEKEHVNKLIESHNQALKTYTKEFKAKIKEAGYTDKQYNKIVDFATKKVKKTLDGGQEIEGYEMDWALQTMRSNPEEATELALFILDKEAYLSKKLEAKEIELKKNIIKQTRIVKTQRSNSADITKTKFEENGSYKNLMPLD